MAKKDYDFSGYVTKNNLECSDGRVILRDAFKHNDGSVVSLVWGHGHNNPLNILGKVLLENRPDGVYGYGTFNDTEAGKAAKIQVQHGDITMMSIFANRLKEKSKKVMSGVIREVSLVISGANPGALIDNVVLAHGDLDTPIYSEDEAYIYTGLPFEDVVSHSDDGEQLDEENDNDGVSNDEGEADSENTEDESNPEEEPLQHSDDQTMAEVFETLNQSQKELVYAMVAYASATTGEEEMKQSDENPDEETLLHTESQGGLSMNVFDQNNASRGVTISKAEIQDIFTDAQTSTQSLKLAFLKHMRGMDKDVLTHSDIDIDMLNGKNGADLKHADAYGIQSLDILFPEAKSVMDTPEFDKRRTGWVSGVLSGCSKVPWARIKSMYADLNDAAARAKGYITGNEKIEEYFGLFTRSTAPQTIYKKQKLDRDQILDITTMDVVGWLKAEMRLMLDEEIARAILIGDGRLSTDADKIGEDHIRPIWTDHDKYTIKCQLPAADDTLTDLENILYALDDYKGSGIPSLYTTRQQLTKWKLLKDEMGQYRFKTKVELADFLGVKDIIEDVDVMKGQTRAVDDKTYALVCIIVNLKDYTCGTDKGGNLAFFENFDINFNQQQYLYETRMSGALTKLYSAVAVEKEVAQG